METHVEQPKKRNLDGLFLALAFVGIAAAVVLGWRNYAHSAPVPPWRAVVGEAQRLAKDMGAVAPTQIVLVGGRWPNASTIDGVEPKSVATLAEAPQDRVASAPKVLLLVRASTWDADGPKRLTMGWPLDSGGGKWLFVQPPLRKP